MSAAKQIFKILWKSIGNQNFHDAINKSKLIPLGLDLLLHSEMTHTHTHTIWYYSVWPQRLLQNFQRRKEKEKDIPAF